MCAVLNPLLPLALVATLGLGCQARQSFETAIPIDDTFPRQPVTGALQERYEAAARWSEARDGLALVILRGDAVIFESYARRYDPSTPIHIFSGTKSFSCALALLLEADGALDLNEDVQDTLPELAAGAGVTPDTLLHFTSGVAQDNRALTRDGLLEEQSIEDKYAYAVVLPSESAPGEVFVYGSSHQAVLGALITTKIGQSPLEYLEARLFTPMGMRFGGWNHDPAGNPMLAYGAWTTANEWLKYGVLLRDGGLWQGQALLPEGGVDRCTTGSAANPAYGMTLWLNEDVADDVDLSAFASLAEDGRILDPDGPADLFAAAGYKDNRLFVVPSEELVIVRLGDGSRRFSDPTLLGMILRGE